MVQLPNLLANLNTSFLKPKLDPLGTALFASLSTQTFKLRCDRSESLGMTARSCLLPQLVSVGLNNGKNRARIVAHTLDGDVSVSHPSRFSFAGLVLGTGEAGALGAVTGEAAGNTHGLPVVVEKAGHGLLQRLVALRHRISRRSASNLGLSFDSGLGDLAWVENGRISTRIVGQEPEVEVGMLLIIVGQDHTQLIPPPVARPLDVLALPLSQASHTIGKGRDLLMGQGVADHDRSERVAVSSDRPGPDPMPLCADGGGSGGNVGVMLSPKRRGITEDGARWLRSENVTRELRVTLGLGNDLLDRLTSRVSLASEGLEVDEHGAGHGAGIIRSGDENANRVPNFLGPSYVI